MSKKTVRNTIEIALVSVLLINGSYLLGRGDASIVYLTNLILHLVLGVLLTGLWTGEAVHRYQEFRSRPGLLSASLFVAPIIAATSGVALIIFGKLTGHAALFNVHVGFALLATLLVLVAEYQSPNTRRRAMVIAVAGLAVSLQITRYATTQPNGARIDNAILAPVSMEGESALGRNSPFFPSPVEVAGNRHIPESFFFRSESCGRSGCHTDVVEQWQSSAHRFSSFNNQWYRKSIEYMQEVGGVQRPKFCAGCHDPAVLFPGNMASPVDSFLTSEAAQTGLACVSCHAISQVKNTAGNAGYILSYPRLHELASSENPALQFLHDRLLMIDPAPHRETFMKPFMEDQPAEYCSSCHKVHLDTDVNGYRWVRGFNTYDNWQASGVSGFGARSFYQPETPMTCVTCHMPERASEDPGGEPGRIRDHRFLAANTALPVANADSAQLSATIAFLQADRLSVDIFGISALDKPISVAGPDDTALNLRSNTSFATGEERSEFDALSTSSDARPVVGGLRSGDRVLESGKQYRLDVVVRSRTIGHFFPTGTVDAQEAWLEVKATSQDGRVLLHSGFIDGGRVDSTAHFYRNRLIDAAGGLIDKRNANAARATVYVNLIPPGAADVAHYVFSVPDDIDGSVHVEARVQYRKFTSDYNSFAYGGVFDQAFDPSIHSFDRDVRSWHFETPDSSVSGALKSLPEIPIVTMASTNMKLPWGGSNQSRVSASKESEEESSKRETALRWNDYGIGLMGNGDLKSAQNAFRRVTEIEPGYADGWINLARGFIREGVSDSAALALEEVPVSAPVFYKASYLKGVISKLEGDYATAITLLNGVRDSFPKDRVVLGDLARTYYLDGQLELAAELFNEVLEIDSEDLTAHYNLMLVYRALGNSELSEAHRARYERFKADEASVALTRAYRSKHPSDNNEALPIHSHR